ncbi:hypothetical protein FNV43_RR10962 [Rhamnella rubrinervis]|uniref:Uncharacterized protein n=1 Tax=Rhamnella rubrinervis TaxID=2594499 RepID=A0A8K0H5C9_9ROSA|nr:hypothetical protein FNV43_RR10962 [Rhamnella rubrinervis]
MVVVVGVVVGVLESGGDGNEKEDSLNIGGIDFDYDGEEFDNGSSVHGGNGGGLEGGVRYFERVVWY